MNKIKGADLALAVAKVMGRSVEVRIYDDIGQCVPGLVSVERAQRMNPQELQMLTWRPDLGGAAGWEALDWAFDKIPGLSIEKDCMIYDIRWLGSDPIESDDLGEAICRAIVAYEEQSCTHQWVDPTNEAIDANGHKVCVLCGAIQ